MLRHVVGGDYVCERFFRCPQELYELFIDRVEAVFERVLQEQCLHLAKRHFGEVSQNKTQSLKRAGPMRSELEQSAHHHPQVVVVLLHDLSALLANLLQRVRAPEVHLEDLPKESGPFLLASMRG